MATVYLQGKACNTNGDLPEIEKPAPDFVLTTTKLKDKTLTNFSGSLKLIYTVSSLDSMVCANTTKTLNELTGQLENTQVFVISADLPFALQKFCKQNKLKNITTLSMMRDKKFAEDYGVLLIDGPLAGLCARAVFILDENNNLIYKELVSDITHSPDFNLAMKKLDNYAYL